jgi:hypothetical protein
VFVRHCLAIGAGFPFAPTNIAAPTSVNVVRETSALHNRPMRFAPRTALMAAAVAAAACGETRGTLVTTGDPGVWRPAPGTTWQVQLSGALDTSLDVAVYDVDLFETTPAEIQAMHAAGRRVICYVSVGTREPWRADAPAFPAAAVGKPLTGYPDESWLDTRDAMVRSLMTARLDVARDKACDGVDLSTASPDGADTGFTLARDDLLAYARLLAGEARRRGLSAGLGGASDLAAAVAPDFQWALAESCLAHGTCAAYAAFVAAQKVVFAVEFGTEADAALTCPRAHQASLDALIKNRAYDAFRVPCP